MNRRAFLTTAAMTPILASAFGPVRAQTGGGRLSCTGHVHDHRGGEQGHLRMAVRRGDGQGHVAGSRRGDRQSELGRGASQQTILYTANELAQPRLEGHGAVTAFSIDAISGTLTRINRVSTNGLAPAHMLVDPTGKWAIVGNYGNGAGVRARQSRCLPLAPTVNSPTRRAIRAARAEAEAARSGGGAAEERQSADLTSALRAAVAGQQVPVRRGERLRRGCDVQMRRGEGRAGAERPAGRRRDEVRRRAWSYHVWKDRKVSLRLLRGRACVTTFAYDAAKGDADRARHSVDAAGGSAADRFVRGDRGASGRQVSVPSRTAATTASRCSRSTRRRGRSSLRGTFRSTARRGISRSIRPVSYVFTEGQNNDMTVVFKIDGSTGQLTRTDVTLDSPAPVCITFV